MQRLVFLAVRALYATPAPFARRHAGLHLFARDIRHALVSPRRSQTSRLFQTILSGQRWELPQMSEEAVYESFHWILLGLHHVQHHGFMFI